MIFVVYEHWRPDTNECFYVGKGSQRRARSFRRINRYHKHILDKLASLGLAPTVRVVFATFDDARAVAHEIGLIAKYGRRNTVGGPLVNLTDGGEGTRGYSHDTVAREKISQTHKGRPKSPEHAAKVGAHHRGRSPNAETRAKISASVRANLNDETRARISQGQRSRWVKMPDFKPALGHFPSAAVRAKMSTSHKLRWARRKKLLAELSTSD